MDIDERRTMIGFFHRVVDSIGLSRGGFDRSSKYRFIQRSLPIAADLLGVPAGDLMIVDRTSTLSTKLAREPDRVVKAVGFEGLPLVQLYNLHMNKIWSREGVTLMEERNTPGLRYAIMAFVHNGTSTLYLLIPRGRAFRLHRAWNRRVKALKVTNDPPILADGVLDVLVRNTVGFLKPRGKFKPYGVKARRGVILDGAPGNGKTMACRYVERLCVEHSIGVRTITSCHLSAAYRNDNLTELMSYSGVTFFDDIDGSFLDRRRNSEMASALLTAMDGMDVDDHVVRVFTTNEQIKDLDPAFTRPGRIDVQITFEKPTDELRRRLAMSWPTAITDEIDVDDLVEWSRGWSFAELENLRSTLVVNHLATDVGWDLGRAFDEIANGRRGDKTKKPIGFGGLAASQN